MSAKVKLFILALNDNCTNLIFALQVEVYHHVCLIILQAITKLKVVAENAVLPNWQVLTFLINIAAAILQATSLYLTTLLQTPLAKGGVTAHQQYLLMRISMSLQTAGLMVPEDSACPEGTGVEGLRPLAPWILLT